MSISSYFSLIPCLFSWETLQDRNKRFTHYRNKKSDEVFGIISDGSLTELQKNLTTLFFALVPVVIALRIPYRIGCVLSGDSFTAGYSLGMKKWKKLERQSILNSENLSLPNFNPKAARFYATKIALKQIVKDIIKIVTYPIALIGMLFAAFYGACINPLDGRALFAFLEHTWSRLDIRTTEFFILKKFNLNKLRVADYLGPCMQPSHIIKKRNFYQFLINYNPQTLRCILNSIYIKLEENDAFFSHEKIGLQYLLPKIKFYQENLYKFSEYHGSEFDKEGKLNQTVSQKLIREKLESLIIHLNQIEETFDQVFQDKLIDMDKIEMEKEAIQLLNRQLDSIFRVKNLNYDNTKLPETMDADDKKYLEKWEAAYVGLYRNRIFT